MNFKPGVLIYYVTTGAYLYSTSRKTRGAWAPQAPLINTGCVIKNGHLNSSKIRAFFAFFYIFLGRIQPYKPFSSKSGPIKLFLIQYYSKTLGPYQKMLKL